MRSTTTLLALASLLLLSGRAWAASAATAGTSAAQFLKLGAGARGGGMADSMSAVVDDSHAVYYNPAALSRLTGAQLAGAHTAYFQGTNYEVLNFAYPYGRDEKEGYSKHVIGFGVYQLSVSDIERRTGDSTDAIGTFGASDSAYSFTYARALERHLSIGVTGKYISQGIDSYRSTAMAADAGVLWRVNPDAERPLSVAGVIRNVGTRSGYAGGSSDPLPTSVTAGLGYQLFPKTTLLNLEVSKYRDTSAFAAAGFEYRRPLGESIGGAFRFGYSSQRKDTPGTLNGLSAGGGFRFNKADFDFAWVPFGNLGDTFRFSLLIRF